MRETGDARAIALLARIDSLEQDHAVADEAHREVDQLGQQWLVTGGLSVRDAERLSTLLDRLLKLYQKHIAIEDGEVFPAAAGLLTAEQRKSVGAEMAARRGVGRTAPV